MVWKIIYKKKKNSFSHPGDSVSLAGVRSHFQEAPRWSGRVHMYVYCAMSRMVFEKFSSCLDHIYLLNSLLSNRKMSKKDTFVCFVDAKKAFVTVGSECLWFKLSKIGIHGDFLRAIQSLYKLVSMHIKINDNFTEWFQVNMRVKQGCVLSPTLFSIYVNDLAHEIKKLMLQGCLWWYFISVLLYADWHSINSWKQTRPAKYVECIVRMV